MRASLIAENDFPLRLTLQRTAGESPEQAYKIACELADYFDRELPEYRLTRPSQPSRTNTGPVALRLIPPVEHVLTQHDYIEVLRAQTVAERQAVVDAVEAVVSEHIERVNSLPLIGWVLRRDQMRLSNLLYLLGYANPRPGEFADAIAAATEYTAHRRELMGPYLEGRYPVKQPALLAEFEQLERHQRKVISWAMSREVDRHSLPAADIVAGALLNNRDLESDWPNIAERLRQQGWLAPMPAGMSVPVGWHQLRDGPR